MRLDFAFATSQPGIETRHVFSSGAHYDPGRMAYGPVVGCDEHTVAVGAGFPTHAHRGVVIVSWVLAGTLRHVGSSELRVGPGRALVQSCGDGIRHAETNGGGDELCFVQTTLLLNAPVSTSVAEVPVALPGGLSFDVRPESVELSDSLAVPLRDGSSLVVTTG
ncbi:cupin domain-containing protein [Jatrophihabitans fulvus]